MAEEETEPGGVVEPGLSSGILTAQAFLRPLGFLEVRKCEGSEVGGG
jgi:hypothetical protein